MQSFVVHWGYLALFLVTAVSAFGIPVGSELTMAYGGALASGAVLAGTHDRFSLGAVIAVAVAGELVGSLCGYALGRFGGRPLVDRIGRYILLSHRDLDRVEAFMARRGDPFVFVGRLVPLLRSFVSIVAGLAEMSLGRFVAFTLAGSAVFTAAVAGAGYGVGANWHKVVKDFSDAGYVAAALAVLAVALGIAHRVKVLRDERSNLSATAVEP
jgi:membrane protein DedA with SNARE-associated domain